MWQPGFDGETDTQARVGGGAGLGELILATGEEGPMSVTRARRDCWVERGCERVLVVDDDADVSWAIAGMLKRDGHRASVAGDVVEARGYLGDDSIDVVVCDVRLPGESGLELIAELARSRPLVATVIMSGVADIQMAEAALDAGADRFLGKPFRRDELMVALSDAIRRRHSRLQSMLDSRRLADTNDHLRSALRDVQERMSASRLDSARRLALAVDYRVHGTAGHLDRVGRICGFLAHELGWPDARCDALAAASALHDVGKIGVPDGMLLKPGAFAPDERKAMERHTLIGYELLRGSGEPLLDLAAEIALNHHEWMNGHGYPAGLFGDQIPIECRIAAVADVFDALISPRVYRDALTTSQAAEMIMAGRGTQFDPVIVDLLLNNLDRLADVLGDSDMEVGE